jgi:hypothetical protein
VVVLAGGKVMRRGLAVELIRFRRIRDDALARLIAVANAARGKGIALLGGLQEEVEARLRISRNDAPVKKDKTQNTLRLQIALLRLHNDGLERNGIPIREHDLMFCPLFECG